MSEPQGRPLGVILCLTALLALGGCASQNVQVYEDTGERQCEGGGLTLAESQARLTKAGIKVRSSACATRTGMAVMAVCGGPTTNIHTHSINARDLASAQELGFEVLDTLVSEEQGIGYELKPCP